MVRSLVLLARPRRAPGVPPEDGARRRRCAPVRVLSAGSIPNRIAQGTLALGVGTHRLAPISVTTPHAIHGVGWQRAWALEAHEPTHARLAFDHVPEGEAAFAWPFAFHATQAFALTVRPKGAMLTLTLAIRNTDVRAFPFGLGWHPFFPRDAATELGFVAKSVWEIDDTCLPTRNVALPPEFASALARDRTRQRRQRSRWSAKLKSLPRTDSRVHRAYRACSHLVVFIPPAGYYGRRAGHHIPTLNRAAPRTRPWDSMAGPGRRRSYDALVATLHDPVYLAIDIDDRIPVTLFSTSSYPRRMRESGLSMIRRLCGSTATHRSECFDPAPRNTRSDARSSAATRYLARRLRHRAPGLQSGSPMEWFFEPARCSP